MEAQAYLDVEQTKKLEEATGCLRDKLLVRILRRIGCRISEVLSLGIEDFHFEAGTVTILHEKTHIRLVCPGCKTGLSRNSKYCPGCGIEVQEAIQKATKNRKVRTIPIDTVTLDMVMAYSKENKLAWKGGRHLLFPFNRQRAWQIIKEAAIKAELPKIINQESEVIHGVSPHKLRDAFAVNALKQDDSGEGQRMLQEHLGHESFNTTAKYRKVSGEEQQKWYKNVVSEEE